MQVARSLWKPGWPGWLGWRRCLWAALPCAVSGCYLVVEPDGDVVTGILDITQQPQSTSAAVGVRAMFSVGVVGSGPITYQWRRNGADIAGANGFTYTTPPVVLADDGALFTVRVCNEVLCRSSRPATLTVSLQ